MDDAYSYEAPSMVANSPMINYRKDARKGIKFTFMVVGEAGTGKTTFINSLLNQKVLSHRFEPSAAAAAETRTLAFTSAKSVTLPNTAILTKNDFNASTAHEEPGIALTETRVEVIDDSNAKLHLSIIDTPGFGENLNNEICFVEIENYLKQQFDLVLAEETRIRRNPRFVDTRVHVMLYFIAPSGHGLKELDVNCMKRLSKYVNVIPVIGRADSFTEAELRHFKKQIRIDIERFNVPVFQFDNYLNEYDENEDYELIEECKFLAKLQPFALICSENEFEVKDAKTGVSNIIKARQYPWGLVDINNPKYSDFPILKSVLLGSHLQDLKDLTHDFLYESYRTERLSKVTGRASIAVDDDSEFQDTKDHPGVEGSVPSLSNLAQLTYSSDMNLNDNASVTSGHSKAKSMLLGNGDDMPSPKLKDSASFTSSTSTISLEHSAREQPSARNSLNTNNPAFKRLSIAPQRNQLRQISETVPYVIRHERILERQQKLEEMEMASAKELANRAALLEQKAAELKAKEKLLKKLLNDKHEKEQSPLAREDSDVIEISDNTVTKEDDVDADETNGSHSLGLRKDETLTDLHSVVEQQS